MATNFLRSFLILISISPEEVFLAESDMVRGYLFERDINYFQLRNNWLYVMKIKRFREMLSMYVGFFKVCDTSRVVCLKVYFVKKKKNKIKHFFFVLLMVPKSKKIRLYTLCIN